MATTKIISDVSVDGAVKVVPLNGSKALASSSDGTVVESSTTATELGYVHGVTSGIQTQIDNIRRVFFSTTQTEGATAVKVFDITDFPTKIVNGVKTPLEGTILIAKSTNGDSRTAQLKFKVNDGGEFPIWYGGAAWTAGPNTVIFGGANRTYAYVFDGAEWVWVSSGYDTNTTYTAGTGLKLSSNQFSLNVPRMTKSCNSLPGINTAIIEEYAPGGDYNLPSIHWYHILTFEGEDSRFATQLALGMTTVAAYYRNYTSSTWGSWLRLDNPTMDSAPTAGNTSNVVSSAGIKTYVDTQVATKSNVIFRQWVTQ